MSEVPDDKEHKKQAKLREKHNTHSDWTTREVNYGKDGVRLIKTCNVCGIGEVLQE